MHQKKKLFILILIAILCLFIMKVFVAEKVEQRVIAMYTKNIVAIKKEFHFNSKPYPQTNGLYMFRGNPTRSSYGTGPLPINPTIAWKYPKEAMCKFSENRGETKKWCGAGWTGQPVVDERADGITELMFGAYDGAVHFVNAETGTDLRPSFQTDDIIKGSIAKDPDNFPLIYFGSRDNKFRIVALDRETPTELWSLNASHNKGLWNDDWDGNPVILNDLLFEGGENGWFYIIKLNRSYDANGKVQVDPKFLIQMPGWTDQLLKDAGDIEVSIENSPALYKDRVYFANSAGRIVGLDISRAEEGLAPIVFDFWTGDDTDASIVIDEAGMLYVGSEEQRHNERGREIGQVMKIDPYTKNNPLVWSIKLPASEHLEGGVWSTMAITKDLEKNLAFSVTNSGYLLTIDRQTGEVYSKTYIGEHSWSSPNIIDGKLVVASCKGNLTAYDFTNPSKLKQIWNLAIPSGSCIETTPAIWKGNFYFGVRDGFFYKIEDKKK